MELLIIGDSGCKSQSAPSARSAAMLFVQSPKADCIVAARNGCLFRCRLLFLRAHSERWELMDEGDILDAETHDCLPVFRIDASEAALDFCLASIHSVDMAKVPISCETSIEAYELAQFWIAPRILAALRERLRTFERSPLFGLRLFRLATAHDNLELMQRTAHHALTPAFRRDPLAHRRELGPDGMVMVLLALAHRQKLLLDLLARLVLDLDFTPCQHTGHLRRPLASSLLGTLQLAVQAIREHDGLASADVQAHRLRQVRSHAVAAANAGCGPACASVGLLRGVDKAIDALSPAALD